MATDDQITVEEMEAAIDSFNAAASAPAQHLRLVYQKDIFRHERRVAAAKAETAEEQVEGEEARAAPSLKNVTWMDEIQRRWKAAPADAIDAISDVWLLAACDYFIGTFR